MYRETAASQVLCNGRVEEFGFERQRFIWQDNISPLYKLPFDTITLDGKIGCGFREIYNDIFTSRLDFSFFLKRVNTLRNVLSEVANFVQELLHWLRSKFKT